MHIGRSIDGLKKRRSIHVIIPKQLQNHQNQYGYNICQYNRGCCSKCPNVHITQLFCGCNHQEILESYV